MKILLVSLKTYMAVTHVIPIGLLYIANSLKQYQYNYEIIDLGKDVSKEKIVEAAIKNNVKLIGLSALMTTTVKNMEETICELKKIKPDCIVMVGGAVLNEEYANMIKADYYVKDANESVTIARKVLG